VGTLKKNVKREEEGKERSESGDKVKRTMTASRGCLEALELIGGGLRLKE